ncbi:sensor histidine kinase [Vibrio atypicus]|uniref:sensor histidine kinase n=1 Tax=Vibrio atypicus TaxID=558271 RepID=UPI001CECB42D|nr:histidine kinase [Vibrio atypicus]
MQTMNERKGTKVIRSFVVTTLFCVVIAFVTQSIWPSEFAEHLLISVGYGYSAVITSHLIAWLAPQVSSYLLTGASLAGAMLFGTMNAHFLLNKYDDFASLEQLKPVIILGFIFSCTCFVFFYAHEQKLIAQKEAEIAKRKQSEHEKAMIQSQLRQLQSQIEPHFLFNTLANVSVLIEQDPAQARLMLEKLTDLLRGTLKSSRQEQSTLQSELDLVDAYLAIQKVRLGQRLDYKIDNSLLSDINLPPLVLQPLVENAIQHGIEPKAEGGCVEIVTQEAGDSLVIEVTDSGVGIHGSSNHAGHGVGLENTQQRLKALFGDEASLALLEVATGGVKAKVSIPLVQLRG